MRFKSEQHESIEPNSYKELQVLNEVEASSDITQRNLSKNIGIALGLTNSLIRSLIAKGYIRAQQASWKRWAYALTPEGFSHKVRLTIAYVHRFMDDYQQVREILRQQLEPLSLHAESRVAIFGTDQFAELVFLGLKELGLDEIDIYSANHEPNLQFLGITVHDITTLKPQDYDRVLVARLNRPPSEELVQIMDDDGHPEKLVIFFKGAQPGDSE